MKKHDHKYLSTYHTLGCKEFIVHLSLVLRFNITYHRIHPILPTSLHLAFIIIWCANCVTPFDLQIEEPP